MREGYEGLVRGNAEAEEAGQPSHPSALDAQVPSAHANDPTFTQNLRFGDGWLLRDGTADFVSEGRSLQGRYIVRVGWDDVRSWLAEVCTIYPITVLSATGAEVYCCLESPGRALIWIIRLFPLLRLVTVAWLLQLDRLGSQARFSWNMG